MDDTRAGDNPDSNSDSVDDELVTEASTCSECGDTLEGEECGNPYCSQNPEYEEENYDEEEDDD